MLAGSFGIQQGSEGSATPKYQDKVPNIPTMQLQWSASLCICCAVVKLYKLETSCRKHNIADIKLGEDVVLPKQHSILCDT